jgi:hypothetical protein
MELNSEDDQNFKASAVKPRMRQGVLHTVLWARLKCVVRIFYAKTVSGVSELYWATKGTDIISLIPFQCIHVLVARCTQYSSYATKKIAKTLGLSP